MSTYWIFVNHTKRERIDPDYVGDGHIKETPITFGDAGRLLTFAMFNAWRGDHVTLEPDGCLDHLAQFTSWPEVSDREIAAFNKRYPDEPMRFATERLPADPSLH